MIGDNKVKDSRGVQLLSEILLYVVYRLITYKRLSEISVAHRTIEEDLPEIP